MIDIHFCDIAVIGAGAAGLAAAEAAAKAGKRVVVLDREERAGGILRQCIHNGFGLRYFKEELTGPEYAGRVARRAIAAGAECRLGYSVESIVRNPDGSFEMLTLSRQDGVDKWNAKAIVLAMGCRERNRGNLAIPGNRPAGIYTAGAAQKLLNIEGMLPGKSAVIVGSGDIGLIMARRLRWSGIEVKGVFEIMPNPSGLTRNIVQCLNDFGIPLHLEHAVINIVGRERVEYIEAAPLHDGIPLTDQKFRVDCDTVLFSVGLIPSNELAVKIGVKLNPATGGAFVDENCQTNIPGVFAGGNVLHVHDLVDFVSEEAARAGAAAAAYTDRPEQGTREKVRAGANLKYAIPNRYTPGKTTRFSFRPLISCDDAELTLEQNQTVIWKKRCRFIRPAEMLLADIPGETLLPNGELLFKLNPTQKEA